GPGGKAEASTPPTERVGQTKTASPPEVKTVAAEKGEPVGPGAQPAGTERNIIPPAGVPPAETRQDETDRNGAQPAAQRDVEPSSTETGGADLVGTKPGGTDRGAGAAGPADDLGNDDRPDEVRARGRGDAAGTGPPHDVGHGRRADGVD